MTKSYPDGAWEGDPVAQINDGWDNSVPSTRIIYKDAPKPIKPSRRVAIPKVTTIDFETHSIEGRPSYPPVPVSVSIKKFGEKARYYAWGHTEGNNSTYGEAKKALEEAWGTPDGLLFHHAKFDTDVAETYFGLPAPPPDRTHDTLFLLFLEDPNQRDLGLKTCAERLLGLKPEERNAVSDWLVTNQPIEGIKISASTSGEAKYPFGKYIPFCPGDIVGKYANGDTERTERLFKYLYPRIVKEGMQGAYERERNLLPTILEQERQGLRVDLPRLRADVAKFDKIQSDIEARLKKMLKAPEDWNLNSGQQVMGLLVERGLIDPDVIPRTEKKGEYKSDEEALRLVSNPAISAMLLYRSKLKSILKTFLKNWLEVAEISGGYIYTSWNQTRGVSGGGARTGRLSSSPNFQNIPNELPDFTKIKDAFVQGLPPLPLARDYIIPYEDGHVLIGRDYSQQEPRILAHFEAGALLKAYQDDPWIDFHNYAKEQLMILLKRDLDRKKVVKPINLGLIYGEGVGSLAQKIGHSVEETRILKNAILSLYPGLKAMYADMRKRAAAGEAVRTWGSRLFYCEPPTIINGRIQEWDYKMVNTLIQGSAGDCTKEAMIRLMGLKYFKQEALAKVTMGKFLAALKRAKRASWRFYLTVHDELLMSVPREDLHIAMLVLRLAMESVEFDLPILSEGVYGETWAKMKIYDEKGVMVYDKI